MPGYDGGTVFPTAPGAGEFPDWIDASGCCGAVTSAPHFGQRDMSSRISVPH
jgi:hypothetical protein